MFRRSRLLTLPLALAVLCCTLYLLRWPVFGGLITDLLSGTVGDAMEADVRFEGLSGSILAGVHCRYVQGWTTDEEGPVRAFFLEDTEVHYDLFRLIRGDYSALSLAVRRGFLAVDFDRPGKEEEETTAREGETVLPDRLPLVKVDSVNLAIMMGGNLYRVEQFAFSMNAPLPGGGQEGRLGADWISITSPELNTALARMDCPIFYRAGRFRIGPVKLQEEVLFDGAASFVTGDGAGAALRIEAKPFGGSLLITGRTDPVFRSFEGAFDIQGIDLTMASVFLPLRAAGLRDLRGIFGAKGDLRGVLEDPRTIEGMVRLRLDNGGYHDVAPLAVLMEAELRDETIRIGALEIDAGQSLIQLLDGRIPFSDGELRMEEAEGKIEIRLPNAERWLRTAGFEREEYPILAGGKVYGSGVLSDGRLRLDRFEIGFFEGGLVFRDLVMSPFGEAVEVEINALDGQWAGRALALKSPARLSISDAVAEVSALVIQVGNAAVSLDGSIDRDNHVKIHGSIDGVDRDLIMEWIPPHLRENLDWEGFSFSADLEGGLFEPHGSVRLDLRTARFHTLRMRDLHVRARIAPDRFDLELLEAGMDEGGRVQCTVGWNLEAGRPWNLPANLEGHGEVTDLDLRFLGGLVPELDGLAGAVSVLFAIQGNLENPQCTLSTEGYLAQVPDAFDTLLSGKPGQGVPWRFQLRARTEKECLAVEQLDLAGSLGSLAVTGNLPLLVGFSGDGSGVSFDWDRSLAAKVTLSDLDVSLDPGLSGWLSGSITLDGPLRYPEGTFTAKLVNATYRDSEPHGLSLEGMLESGVLEIRDLTVVRPGGDLLKGRLALDLNGSTPSTVTLPGLDSSLEVYLAMEHQSIDPYAAMLGVPMKARLSLLLEGGGNLGEPNLEMSMALDQGEVALPSADIVMGDPTEKQATTLHFGLQGTLVSNGRTLEIQTVRLESGPAVLKGSGTFPVGLGAGRNADDPWLDQEGKLEAFLDASEVDLDTLADLIPDIRRISGLLSAHVELSGTPASPDYKGRLRWSRGALRLESRLPSMQSVEAEIEVSPEVIEITRFYGEMGAGPVHAEGRVFLSDFVPRSFDLKVTGDNTLLYRGSGVRVRADLDLKVGGPYDKPLIAGTVVLRDTRVVKHISFLPERGPRQIESDIFGPFSLTDPFGRNITFDLTLRTEEDLAVYVRNNLARGGINVDLKLLGTGFVPFLVGSATFNDLILTLPNFTFKVDTGRLTFPKDNPLEPSINLFARGKKLSYEVDLLVEGQVADPEIILSASPPLAPDQLLVLVTTGMFPSDTQALTKVGAYLGGELYHDLFGDDATESGESYLDRLEVNFGSEVGTDGRENILVEYNFHGPWFVQVEQDIYTFWNAGIVYRIRFR